MMISSLACCCYRGEDDRCAAGLGDDCRTKSHLITTHRRLRRFDHDIDDDCDCDDYSSCPTSYNNVVCVPWIGGDPYSGDCCCVCLDHDP